MEDGRKRMRRKLSKDHVKLLSTGELLQPLQCFSPHCSHPNLPTTSRRPTAIPTDQSTSFPKFAPNSPSHQPTVDAYVEPSNATPQSCVLDVQAPFTQNIETIPLHGNVASSAAYSLGKKNKVLLIIVLMLASVTLIFSNF